MVFALKKYHRRRLWLKKIWREERSGMKRYLPQDDLTTV